MNNTGLNILFVTPFFPYPLIGGERVKAYHILKHLAKHNKITLLCLEKGKKTSEIHFSNIRDLGIEVHYFHLNHYLSSLKALLLTPNGKPLETEYFKQNAFSQTLNNLLNNNKFDLVINFFLRTAEHTKNIDAKKILILDDCRTLYQFNTYKQSKNIYQKALRYWEYRRLKKYEAEIGNYFDVTTLITNDDYLAIRQLNPKAKYEILSNGTDLSVFNLTEEHSQRNGLLFIGKLDVWANHLMLVQIIKKYIPAISAEMPDAEFTIAGFNPPSEIKKLKLKNVKFAFNVVSSNVFYQKSLVFMLPHFAGSGLQNKALEAMACGCALVSAPNGVRGIGAEDKKHYLIADSDDEFVQHCIYLMKNKDAALKMGENAAEYIKVNFAWESIEQKLDEIIAKL